MLSLWECGDPTLLLNKMNSTTLKTSTFDIDRLNNFLKINLLVVPDSEETLNLLKMRVTKKKPGIVNWLLKNYLFFRVPLFKPDRFLEATLPFARVFVSRPFLYCLFFIGFLGLFQVIRQWNSFTHTFLYFFSLQGVIIYGLAILASKFFHELGHAYTSKYYGLRVPTIGLAFLILWPVLYSDNTEAWRIKNRRSRINIVAAGILAELALALIATFFWGILPDGPLRSVCFITATITWISSLLINMSPFLRFDGYYLFADFLEMPNLHTRSFEFGKWHMRKTFLGLNTGCPENLPSSKRRLIILFAYFTWLYRLILFTGIAIVIYHFSFKLLGVFLFIMEIMWFIILPVYREFNMWWKNRLQIGINKKLIATFSALCLSLTLLFIPINTKINLPALIKPGIPYRIYPPFSARLTKITVSDGSLLKQGELMFLFDSPFLDSKIKRLHIQVKTLVIQLKRSSQKSELIEQQHVIQQKLSSSLTELEGYVQRKQQLSIKAPTTGIIKDIPVGLVPGRWVNSNQLLSVLVKTKDIIIESYSNENQLSRISPDDHALFYPETGDFAPIECRVKTINKTSSRILDEPYLASTYGGKLAVRVSSDKLVSYQSLYRILLVPEQDDFHMSQQIHRGNIIIFGRPESIAIGAFRKAIAVIIRESSF